MHSDPLSHDTAPIFLRKRMPQTLAMLAMLAAFAGCSTNPANKRNEQYGVSVHALNYSSREVAYIAVEQPGHPEGGAGGDALNPYGGGGDICCFPVPAKWRPDFRVVVVYQFYPETAYRRVEVGVPPYPNGKAGDIWLIVHPDFTVEAVVSDWGPSRPEWPGSIKGYPVPSKEYARKRWQEKIDLEKADKAAFEKDLNSKTITPSQRQDYLNEIIEINKNIEYMEKHKP